MPVERYKVTRTDGWLHPLASRTGGRDEKLTAHASFAVLDRLACHRELVTFRSEDQATKDGARNTTIVERVAAAEALALAYAANLNHYAQGGDAP